MKRIAAIALVISLWLLQISTVTAQKTSTPNPTKVEGVREYKRELFQQINALREERSLSVLKLDNALAAAAQEQAEYLTRLGYISEKSPRSSSLSALAIDHGFGGGAAIILKQNTAVSNLQTQPSVIINSVWLTDGKDRVEMLDKVSTHIGIGVSESDARRFIVVLFGALESGDIDYTPIPTRNPQTPSPQILWTPTRKSIIAATANPDGSIIHLIREGETLSEISLAYDVDWNTLAALNKLDLTDPLIIEGQSLLIQAKFTATVTPTITRTPRPPTRTPRPTFTADLAATLTPGSEKPTVTAVPTELVNLPQLFDRLHTSRKQIAWALIGVSVLGLILVFLIRKKG